MDALDWFHLLTPLALIIVIANCLTAYALMPEYRSARLSKYSKIGYSGILLGWLVMKLGTTFSNVSVMTNICIIGWLVLMPSLILTAVCFITRVKQERRKYKLASLKLISILALATGSFFNGIRSLLNKAARILATMKSNLPSHSTFEETPTNSSSFDETVGGFHVFSKNPEGIFGEEYSHPDQDPFTNNWSSR